MRSRVGIPVLLASLTLCACTETPPDETEGTTTDDPNSHVKIVTEEFDVVEGDSFECLYTDVITDRDLAVVSADGLQGPGGHHISVYYADDIRDPEHHPCNDEEMVNWHQVVGANGEDTGEPVVSLPDGLAFKVPAGKQIVIQAHYINVTGETQRYHDEVTLNLVDPADIKAYANLLGISDMQFQVQASAKTTHASVVTLKEELQLIILGGHMHEAGNHYVLETLDEAGAVNETLLETDWSTAFVSHPPMVTRTMEDPLVIPKGTTVRQTCTWNNTSAEAMVFPREMCVTFGYFFPDEGTGEIIYLSHPEPAP